MPETKRRIRPVIEEIVEEKPKVKEEVVAPPEMPKKREEEHHHEHHHSEPQPIYTPEEPLEVTHTHAKDLLAEIASGHSDTKGDRMNMKLLFAITIVTALVVGFISGGVYVYVTGVRPDNSVAATPTPTSSPSASVTPVATATASPVVVTPDVLAALKVSVLNGSGQIGGAGKVKALMENAGFKVGNTGNATSFNYTDTMIQTTDKVSAEVVSTLKKALSKDYSVEVGKALPLESKWDIVVTVGSK